MLQSLELLVGIPQILVFNFVRRLNDLAVLPSRGKVLSEEVDRGRLTQVFLECLLRSLGHRNSSLSIVNQLLLKVQKLTLETWVRINHLTFRFYVAHGLEQAPISDLHQVSDDAGGRPRLPSITAVHQRAWSE